MVWFLKKGELFDLIVVCWASMSSDLKTGVISYIFEKDGVKENVAVKVTFPESLSNLWDERAVKMLNLAANLYVTDFTLFAKKIQLCSVGKPWETAIKVCDYLNNMQFEYAQSEHYSKTFNEAIEVDTDITFEKPCTEYRIDMGVWTEIMVSMSWGNESALSYHLAESVWAIPNAWCIKWMATDSNSGVKKRIEQVIHIDEVVVENWLQAFQPRVQEKMISGDILTSMYVVPWSILLSMLAINRNQEALLIWNEHDCSLYVNWNWKRYYPVYEQTNFLNYHLTQAVKDICNKEFFIWSVVSNLMTCWVIACLKNDNSRLIPYISSCILPWIETIDWQDYYYKPCSECIKCHRIMHCCIWIDAIKEWAMMWYDYAKLRPYDYYTDRIMWNNLPDLVERDISQIKYRKSAGLQFMIDVEKDPFLPNIWTTLEKKVKSLLTKQKIWND